MIIMFSKGLKEEFSILWPFYLDVFVGGIVGAIIAPVMILYFQDLSFSFTQISMLYALPLIATFIFEIPTGAVADIYGRKVSVLLSLIFGGILTAIVPFFKEFSIIALIFFVNAITSTLSSGADEAWVVDLLKHKKRSNFVQHFYSRRLTLMGAGIAIGGLISSAAVLLLGMASLWFITAAGCFFIAFIFYFFAEEHFVRRTVKIKKAIYDSFRQSKQGIQYVLKHPVLLYFFLDTIVWSFAAIFLISWQPYFRSLGLGNEKFGLLFSIVGTIAIFAPMASTYVLRFFRSEKNAIIVTGIIQGLLLILLATATSLLTALAFFILTYPLGVAIEPIAAKFKQQYIPSKQRATISSVFKAVAVPGAILSYVIGGTLLDIFGMRTAIFAAAIAAFVGTSLYFMMKPEGQKVHF
jgi:MFS family permease